MTLLAFTYIMLSVQQCMVLRRMIRDLHFGIKMNVCPTVREQDGLAMSSRNVYLSPSQRQHALVLYRALMLMQNMYNNTTKHAPTIVAAATDYINKAAQQVADSGEDWEMKLDYISINAPDDLSEITGDINNGCIISGAVFVGKTRLIDNLIIDVDF